MSCLTARAIQTEEELRQALEIRREVFILEQGVPEEEERDELDPSAHHFLALWGEAAIGTARLLTSPGSSQGRIGRVAVLQRYRGRGVGEALMSAAEATARALGLDQIVLDAQIQVIRFYERLGYSAVGPLFRDAGILHRRMERRLREGAEGQ